MSNSWIAHTNRLSLSWLHATHGALKSLADPDRPSFAQVTLGNDAVSTPNRRARGVLVVNRLFRLFILGTGVKAHLRRFLDVKSGVKSRVHFQSWCVVVVSALFTISRLFYSFDLAGCWIWLFMKARGRELCWIRRWQWHCVSSVSIVEQHNNPELILGKGF